MYQECYPLVQRAKSKDVCELCRVIGRILYLHNHWKVQDLPKIYQKPMKELKEVYEKIIPPGAELAMVINFMRKNINLEEIQIIARAMQTLEKGFSKKEDK